MPNKTRLVYGDFRPLRRGEEGYSPTRRLLVSESTGERITRRQFINRATRIAVPQKTRPGTYARKEPGTPRKPRADKGITRKDYNQLVKPLLESWKKAKRENKRALSTELAKERYEAAKRKHNFRINKQREQRGYTPRPLDEEPDEPEFYDRYDVIKHPGNYDGDSIADARDYFYDTEFEDEPEFDYPVGETP